MSENKDLRKKNTVGKQRVQNFLFVKTKFGRDSAGLWKTKL
jgi:hypothetical protein